MELTYNELRKRDVINLVDGTCLGRISDLRISFPRGVMTGIYVPGQKGLFSRIFDRRQIYIDRSKIVKIGGDVILVNINCGDTCSPSVIENAPGEKLPNAKHPCGLICPPPCPPKPSFKGAEFNKNVDFSILSGSSGVDGEEY